MNAYASSASLVALLVACGSSSGTSAQQAAQTLCDRVCSCSSTCTVASIGTNNQAKDPLPFGSSSACQSFYAPFLTPSDGSTSVDPSACASGVASAQCVTDPVSNSQYLVPPSACGHSVNVVDAGGD